MLSRFNIAAAFRSSRTVAGGTTGSLFALGTIFMAPLTNFLYGYGPAITTFLVSSTVFISKIINNFKSSNPHDETVAFKMEEMCSTTQRIINKLQLDQSKTHHFLHKHHFTNEEITQILTWTVDSENDVNDLLNKLYNDLECNLMKYPASGLFFILMMSSHFSEIMLLKAFKDPDMFTFDNGVTIANVLLCSLGCLGLINGIAEFKAVKASYEQPDMIKLSNTLFNAYDEYAHVKMPLRSSCNYNEHTPLRSVV